MEKDGGRTEEEVEVEGGYVCIELKRQLVCTIIYQGKGIGI